MVANKQLNEFKNIIRGLEAEVDEGIIQRKELLEK
jgi:hypothetical protein